MGNILVCFCPSSVRNHLFPHQRRMYENCSDPTMVSWEQLKGRILSEDPQSVAAEMTRLPRSAVAELFAWPIGNKADFICNS